MSEEIEIAGIKVPQADWAATPASIQTLVVLLEARSYIELEKAIEKAFDDVSLEDIKNWFKNCYYCTSLD